MTEDTVVVETETETVDVDPVEDPQTQAEAKPRARRKPEIKDPDDAVLELRRENERLRKRLEKDTAEKAEKLAEERILIAKEEAVADAQKTLDERIVEMEARARARVLKSEVKAAAIRAGVADFDDLYAVMTHSDLLSKVEFDDDGNVMNVGEVIAGLKTAKPHLFAGVSTSSTSTPPQSKPHVVDRPALSMTKEDYERAKARLNQL
jgi:hypothetical protein